MKDFMLLRLLFIKKTEWRYVIRLQVTYFVYREDKISCIKSMKTDTVKSVQTIARFRDYSQ